MGLVSVTVKQACEFSCLLVSLTSPSAEIPHFKEVIIMATNCDACGHRTNEVRSFWSGWVDVSLDELCPVYSFPTCPQVKSGGAIEPLGTKITLHVTDPSDMTRDILKVWCCFLCHCPFLANFCPQKLSEMSSFFRSLKPAEWKFQSLNLS